MDKTSGDAASTGRSVVVDGAGKESKHSRLPLVDALRAAASTMIAWHHFTLYPPLSTHAMPYYGDAILWVRDHARAAQVFFVVSGFILAQTMLPKFWDARAAGRFIAQRYCRLGLPYLGAIAVALAVWAFARHSISGAWIDPPPTWGQLLAHLFFLQDILRYDGVSAGLWFVCISMQLSLLFVAGLFVRDAIAGRSGGRVRKILSNSPMLAGWLLAAASLFYFNCIQAWNVWAVYFFGQFFLGVVVCVSLRSPRSHVWLVLYALMVAVALSYDYRGRLLTTLGSGLVLFAGGKYGFMSTWPESRVVGFMGRTSYSLFLVHYPVMIMVATMWTLLDWMTPTLALVGLFVSYFLSIAAAAVFFRLVESPATKLSNRFR